jgi:hypothetical protein
MSVTTQRLCAWGGPVLAVLWIGGFWVLSGFMPPPSPSLSAAAIADIYRAHPNPIRAGILLTVSAGALLGPFFALVSVHMRRIDGDRPILSYTQLVLAALIIVEIVIPLSFVQVAAFRPDRSPEAIQMANDTAWLMFVGIDCTAVLQFLVIGLAILRDQRDTPIFPRWSGYYCIWTALFVTPGSLVPFFKTGPFAWDGIMSWWVPVAVLALWFFVMTPVLLRAIAVPDVPDAATGAGAGELDPLRRIELMEVELAALRAEVSGSMGRK